MSDNSSTAPRANYPGLNNTDENSRLLAQHNLVVSALGGLVLCPVDLAKENFQALDSGTANGYFLYALRKELKHPESATLIGTDINKYPAAFDDLPAGAIQLQTQNFLDPWPTEWEGKFDFVQQRAAMANVPDQNQAVDVVRRLIKLVKPGGWIQLVDGVMPNEEILADDPPSKKVWKIIGRFLSLNGLDGTQGTRVKDFLTEAGGVQNIQSKSGISVIGKGCAPGMEEHGYNELRGLRDTVPVGLSKVPNPPATPDEFRKLIDEAMEEASTQGVGMNWYAAWAQRAE